jgi:hypothetical protein
MMCDPRPAQLQAEITDNRWAILDNLGSILECSQCDPLLRRQAANIILYSYVDAPTIMTSESSRRMLTWMLQHIHVVNDDDGGWEMTQLLAAQMLQRMLPTPVQGGGTFIAKDIREPLGAVLDQIVSILTREAAGTTWRWKGLEEAMVKMMPKVIINYLSTSISSLNMMEAMVSMIQLRCLALEGLSR